MTTAERAHQPSAASRSDAGRGPTPHIFAFAPNRWDDVWMNRQQLLSRLAGRGWPVTYSTGALSVWDRGSPQWKTAPWVNQYRMHDGVCIETPGKTRVRWPRFAAIDNLVVRRHAAALRQRERRASSGTIAHIFHPDFQPYARALGCRWTVYHAYDLFSQQPSWTDQMARMEDDLVANADLVIATSPSVLQALRGADPGRSAVVPNGADAETFASGPSLPCPADLAAVPRPRIGYIGNLNRKVDFPMIAAVAQERPQWHWVLIGPVSQTGPGAPDNDPQLAPAYRTCLQLPNIHFLGMKPHTELPAYAGHMNVNVICYRGDRGWWNAAVPLKLHEYLATGHPVISINLPDIGEHGDVVTFVHDIDGWKAGIESALGDQPTAAVSRRRNVALANSWDVRVDQLEQLLEAMVSTGSSQEA
jgi:glycosyltransferase involved in cell wall biosynthesis